MQQRMTSTRPVQIHWKENADCYVQRREPPPPPTRLHCKEQQKSGFSFESHSILYTESLFLLIPHCIGKCNSLAWELFNIYIYIYKKNTCCREGEGSFSRYVWTVTLWDTRQFQDLTGKDTNNTFFFFFFAKWSFSFLLSSIPGLWGPTTPNSSHPFTGNLKRKLC